MVGPTGRKARAPLNLESAWVHGPGKVASNIQTVKNKLADKTTPANLKDLFGITNLCYY